MVRVVTYTSTRNIANWTELPSQVVHKASSWPIKIENRDQQDKVAEGTERFRWQELKQIDEEDMDI